MNYKIEQKLNEWSYKVEQENLITWSNVLNDPNPIHLDNKIVIRIQLFDLNSGEVVYESSKNEYENRIEFLIRDIIIDMSNVTGFSIPDQLFKSLSNDQSIDKTINL